ncbi:MAG: hypothetical protein HY711_06660 [Candidatus Melainabacteria bacterium]|nr:hypothetical protein [Candidatus Melainabacteria bacterium]
MSRFNEGATSTTNPACFEIENEGSDKQRSEQFHNLNRNLQAEANNPRKLLARLRSSESTEQFLTFSNPYTTDSYSTHVQTQSPDRQSSEGHSSQRQGSDKQSSDNNLENVRSTTACDSQREWTICINLNASDVENGVQIGGNAEYTQLQQLASQTAGKPVTVLVQNVVENPNRPGAYLLNCYEISNGQVNQLPQTECNSLAQGVTNLLTTATQNYPSEKIALINQSHGGGTAGLSDGQRGNCSLDNFVNAVRQGLAGSGHQKLDLLDFDACSMGNSGVAGRVSEVAEHMVASAAPEMGYGGSYDAQNLTAIVKDVLDNPQMNGNDLGEAIVENANAGLNGNSVESPGNNHHEGTDTLAHFHLRRYEEFRGALNNLGNALAQVAQDPRQQEVLQQIIQNTPSYPAGRQGSSTRDLQQFAQQVTAAIDTGQLNDPDGSLRQTANALLSAQDNLTGLYHANSQARQAPVDVDTQNNENSPRAGYEQMGGLSVFLPSHDTNEIARNLTPLSRLRGLTGIAQSQLEQPTQQDNEGYQNSLTTINKQMSLLEQQLPSNLNQEQQQQITTLKQAVDALNQAQTKEQRTAALSNLSTLATALFNSQLNEQISAHSRAEAQRLLKMELQRQEQTNPNEAGWMNFLRSVYEVTQ